MVFQKSTDCFPAGDLVAMLEHGDEKWLPVLAFEVNQCRTIQHVVQGGSRALQQSVRNMVEFGKFHLKGLSVMPVTATELLKTNNNTGKLAGRI